MDQRPLLFATTSVIVEKRRSLVHGAPRQDLDLSSGEWDVKEPAWRLAVASAVVVAKAQPVAVGTAREPHQATGPVQTGQAGFPDGLTD